MGDSEKLIRDILNELDAVYPQQVHTMTLRKTLGVESNVLSRALFSLYEDGFINAALADSLDGRQIAGAAITTKGQRRLRGESEFVTVKLHDDTLEALRVLLLEAITQTTLPAERKGALKRAIESAPTATVTELVKVIFSAGLQKAPDLWNQIQAILSRLA